MTSLGNIRRLTGYIGAELTGLQLSTLDEEAFQFVRRAFLEHQVIFLRDQELSPAALAAFAGRFGEIDPPHAGLTVLPENPDLMIVETKAGVGSGKYNTVWHSDVSFDATPPALSIMRAVKLPGIGGDTLFSSMYAAYDNLAEPIRTMIEPLEAFHDGVSAFSWSLGDPARTDGQERLMRMKTECPGAVHPVVRSHPETGRKALYVNRLFTARIMGMSQIESRNLLNLLCDHAEQPTFQVRWSWAEGDVAMWDNRCAMHQAAMDYGMQHRVMHRATVKGGQPR